MNNIIRTVPAILAAAFAATATLTASAATAIYWKGGSGTEAEPRDVYDRDNWTGSNTYSGNSIGQFPAGQHNFHFKVDSLAYLTNSSPNAVSGNICEQMIFHNGDYAFRGSFKTSSNFVLGYNAGDMPSVAVDGGSLSVGGDVTVSLSDNGTLTINGGTVTVATTKAVNLADAANKTGTLNLNGGTLTTKQVQKGNNKGTGNLNFNGGTLKANAVDSDGLVKNGVLITVLAGGGTIDCNGMDIAIDAQWSTDSVGGMNFTGGNGNTISIINTRLIKYPGFTSIAPGTRLAISNLGASKNVISNGIVVAGVPAVGDVIFTCTRGDGYTLAGVDVAAHVKCPIAPETTFALDSSNTNIVVTSVGASLAPAFWTGAANDGDLSNPANWTDNAVPGPGTNATIFCTIPATLTKGDSFAPSSITFAKGSAAVTINGDDITGVTAVTNLSSASHTINAKVYFTGDIKVKQAAMAGRDENLTKVHVTFAGGAYAAEGCSLENANSAPVYSRCIFGEYFFANTAAWTASYSSYDARRHYVANRSRLHIPYAGDLQDLYIGTNAQVTVGSMALGSGRPCFKNYGEMVVTNLTATGSSEIRVTNGQGSTTPGVFKFGTVTNKLHAGNGAPFYFADAYNVASRHVFYIGEGGLNFNTSVSGQSSIYVIGRENVGNHETIRPWYSDFTIGARPGTGNPAGLRFFRDVEFCTDDESGTGRTITLEARTQVQANKVAAITVSGSGTLEVTQPADIQNNATVSVVVTNTATLAYTTADATLGSGAMTLGAGTTLEYTNSGNTLALPCSSLTLPSSGTATLRVNGDRLKSGDHVLATGVSSVGLDVELAPSVADGRKYVVTVKDGKLVLTVKTGLMFFVR